MHRSRQACGAAAIASSMSRPNGSRVPARPTFSARREQLCSPSTRPIASRNGGTISGPNISALPKRRERSAIVQLIAVTATADAPTRADIVQRSLFAEKPRVFVRSFDRPNLHLAMRRKTDAARQIEAMIARHKGQSGIVYCNSRKGVENLSRHLSQRGVPALPYHAGLEAALRSAHQDEFLHHDGVVIVATIAFGMGIDKPNVRFVCHADLPQSIEAYYQEIGRAGRDGLPAETLTLFSDADISWRERQIEEGGAPQDRKRMEKRKLNALIALCESPRCRRQTLLAAFGEASKPCGNCDICDGKWALFNGAIAAQKVMSAIHRTSGRFFSGHLGNLLAGRATEAIRRHGHDLLPTFGVGKEFKPAEWRRIFHQLHAADLIAQDPEDRDRWILTEDGRAVLKGEAPLTLRREISLPGGRQADVRRSLAGDRGRGHGRPGAAARGVPAGQSGRRGSAFDGEPK